MVLFWVGCVAREAELSVALCGIVEGGGGGEWGEGRKRKGTTLSTTITLETCTHILGLNEDTPYLMQYERTTQQEINKLHC